MSSDQRVSSVATGRDIILTIGRTMHEGLEPLLTRVLAPSLYQVYLHSTDYDRLRNVLAKIETEARQHLDRELARLNQEAEGLSGRLSRIIGRRLPAVEPPMRYESTDGHWSIQFQEDPNGELHPGDVEVVAELSGANEVLYGSGSRTHRIVRTTRRFGKMETRHQYREAQEEEASTGSSKPLAWFHWKDEGGSRAFPMDKDEIVIGRRAEDVWVDLHLDTTLEVSREHVRVRHRGGTFWIKDLSTYGTVVNGRSVRPSLVKDGGERDIDHWEELPDGATIELASVITLEFKVASK